MRLHGKTDSNQRRIVGALRASGCTVQSLASLGDGCPDLLVGCRLRNWLFEVKDPKQPPSKRKLTPMEATWRTKWRGQVATIETVEEALAVINDKVAPMPRVTIVDEGKR